MLRSCSCSDQRLFSHITRLHFISSFQVKQSSIPLSPRRSSHRPDLLTQNVTAPSSANPPPCHGNAMLLCSLRCIFFFPFFFVVWCLGKHFVWFSETIDLGLLQWLWVCSFFLFFFFVWCLGKHFIWILKPWLWVCGYGFVVFLISFFVWCLSKHFSWFIETVVIVLLKWLWVCSLIFFFFFVWCFGKHFTWNHETAAMVMYWWPWELAKDLYVELASFKEPSNF